MSQQRLIIFGIISSILLIVLLLGGCYLWQQPKSTDNKTTETSENIPESEPKPEPPAQPTPPPAQPTPPPVPANPHGLDEPIAEFKARVTKKSFGAYITPATSPVQPERFSGYHAGVDVEYQDVTADVPVIAIADGQIVYSGWVSGYGGVQIQSVTIDGTPRLALYGHIRPSSLLPVGTTVSKGQQIGLLGAGFSQETDNERRHLHFAILASTEINLRGYAPSQAGLTAWLDPLTFYP